MSVLVFLPSRLRWSSAPMNLRCFSVLAGIACTSSISRHATAPREDARGPAVMRGSARIAMAFRWRCTRDLDGSGLCRPPPKLERRGASRHHLDAARSIVDAELPLQRDAELGGGRGLASGHPHAEIVELGLVEDGARGLEHLALLFLDVVLDVLLHHDGLGAPGLVGDIELLELLHQQVD